MAGLAAVGRGDANLAANSTANYQVFAMTERTRMHFAVRASASGKPFIVYEPMVENLSILDRGFLGFDLKPGTTNDEAERLARELNDAITSVSYTVVPGWGEKRR